jgi:DNA-binding transcriptional MocR family regulator
MSCADVSRPGVLRPGSKLPTEVELMGEFDVSRVVARLAVGVLRTEGLIYSRLRMMRFKGWVRSNLACRLSLDNVPRWCQRGGGDGWQRSCCFAATWRVRATAPGR